MSRHVRIGAFVCIMLALFAAITPRFACAGGVGTGVGLPLRVWLGILIIVILIIVVIYLWQGRLRP